MGRLSFHAYLNDLKFQQSGNPNTSFDATTDI